MENLAALALQALPKDNTAVIEEKMAKLKIEGTKPVRATRKTAVKPAPVKRAPRGAAAAKAKANV